MDPLPFDGPVQDESDIVDLNTPGGKPLVSIDQTAVLLAIDTAHDEGAFHRALVICRDLCRLGHWDGRSLIVVVDAYGIYNSIDQRVSVTYGGDGKSLVVRKYVS